MAALTAVGIVVTLGILSRNEKNIEKEFEDGFIPVAVITILAALVWPITLVVGSLVGLFFLARHYAKVWTEKPEKPATETGIKDV